MQQLHLHQILKIVVLVDTHAKLSLQMQLLPILVILKDVKIKEENDHHIVHVNMEQMVIE